MYSLARQEKLFTTYQDRSFWPLASVRVAIEIGHQWPLVWHCSLWQVNGSFQLEMTRLVAHTYFFRFAKATTRTMT